mmetsp:Transcript_283/g.612  ORF Transcript_283/g.612 Transcript_283/m.612 type:complete len:478 (-) Transcript_283:7-1440(-)
MAGLSENRVGRSASSDGQSFSNDELQELREAVVLMTGSKESPRAEQRRDELRSELAAVTAACAEMDKEDSETPEQQEDHLESKHSADLGQRRSQEQALQAKLKKIEAETQQLRAQKAKQSSQEASHVAKLRQELDEAAKRLSHATAAQRSAPPSAAVRKSVAELAEVSRKTSERREAFEVLQNEEAALQEELGTLRFSIKDVKAFQHRRALELDAQAKKLEKQKKQLEDQQSAKAQPGSDASAAEAQVASTITQLNRVQQLNKTLTSLAKDVDEQRELQEREEAQVMAEYYRLQEQASAGMDLRSYNERLDAMSEEEGGLRRDIRQLRNQVQQRQRLVQCLEKTAEQTRLQLAEAETANSRLREEEEASERRAEIFRWKWELVESLQKPRKKKQQPQAVKESGASSSADSPSGGTREVRRDSNQASAGATSAGSDDGFEQLICARCSSDPARLRSQGGCPSCEARVSAIRSDADSSV